MNFIMNKIVIYIKSILVPVIVGGVVGLIISRYMDYNILEKPFLSPPGIVFPIVWTILYILMGVSYGILENKGIIDKKINFIYYLQLGVNAFWPILFFVFKWRLFSFFWIVFLIFLVINMIVKFWNKDIIAGLIQIPYLIWLVFATYLNLGIYILNVTA